MGLHGLIPLVQAVARDAELTRQLRNRFAARSHLTHRFELELRRELLTLDHGAPPGPLSPLSGVRISRATPGSLSSLRHHGLPTVCALADDSGLASRKRL